MKLYHATYLAYMDSIFAEGLGAQQLKNWDFSMDNVVCLADDIDLAISFCETADNVPAEIYDSGIVCIEVSIDKLDPERLSLDPNFHPDENDFSCYCYRGIIEPQNLQLIWVERSEIESINFIAQSVRNEMVELYGPNLHGKCIEASGRIVKRLSDILHLEAKTVEGWCRFDDENYGSDRPWDPHTWVEIPSLNLYVDVTADQFNWGMFSENDYSSIIVREGLPHGMQYEEPAWDDFEAEHCENTSSDIQYGIDDNWLHHGQKVKILNQYFEGQIATIDSYKWTTGSYIVTMPNGHNLPFRPCELEKVEERKASLDEQILSAGQRAAEPGAQSKNHAKEQSER